MAKKKAAAKTTKGAKATTPRKTKRTKSVAVDLDGTILTYDGWRGPTHYGEPIEGATEFLAKVKEKYRVVIHTCRDTHIPKVHDALEAHLKKHKLPFDSIWKGTRKPPATAYVDDKGVSCRPQEDINDYDGALRHIDYIAEQDRIMKEESKKPQVHGEGVSTDE